ncbi:subtilisin-like serine protease [Haplosporangium gracile]|nr:subtilisin-like serine protease [Haplosporangium gracile]
MKYAILIVAIIAAVQAAPLVVPSGNQRLIPDSYIVVLKDNAAAPAFKTKFDGIAKKYNGRGRAPEIHREYTAIPGFHASFDAATLKAIQAHPDVAYVEQDAVVTIQASQSPVPSWGLTRVSERDLNLSSPYYYNDLAGSGVTAYVIDSGIYAEHNDFGGRATFGANFISGSANTDENGHGTHVAGTIGSTTFGVAKKVKIVGVKVLGADGKGSNSGIIAGMDWVAARAVPGKSVVNMSLGGGYSKAVNDAAGRLYAKDIPLFIAAGNSANDACNNSPASAPGTYTVGSIDSKGYPAWDTSYGSCVQIFGPGVEIISTWIGGPWAYNTDSGTSMATPHVAGVAALYIAQGGLNTAQSVFDKLTATSTKNVVKGNLNGTPNLLVYNGGAN